MVEGEGGKTEAKRGGEDRGEGSGNGVRMRGTGERKMNKGLRLGWDNGLLKKKER